jgi:hypothetical protein
MAGRCLIRAVGWEKQLLPPFVVHLDRDVVLLNQSSGLGLSDLFPALLSYDLVASMAFDPLARNVHAAWSLDPSLVGIRRSSGVELLSMWEDQCLRKPNETSRQGHSRLLSLSFDPSLCLSPPPLALMTVFEQSPRFRYLPLSPLYNFRLSSFGFLSLSSSVPIATSSTPLLSPPPSPPINPFSTRRIYLTIASILEDALERVLQAGPPK